MAVTAATCNRIRWERKKKWVQLSFFPILQEHAISNFGNEPKAVLLSILNNFITGRRYRILDPLLQKDTFYLHNCPLLFFPRMQAVKMATETENL